MKKNKKIIVLAVIIGLILCCFLCLILATLYYLDRRTANSFEECAAKGGAIAESYPRQCFLAGKSFTEEIEVTPTPTTTETPTPTATATPTPQLGNNEFFTDVDSETPSGWSVKVTNSVDLEEAGLPVGTISKIEILNGNNSKLELNMIGGVGGSGQCDEVFKFGDTDANYIQNLLEMNKEFFDIDSKVTTLSNSYSEFNVLDERFRRIGQSFYWDVTNATDLGADYMEYFDPGCGISAGIHLVNHLGNVRFKALTANEQDLKIVDSIVDSLVGTDVIKLP